MGACCLAKWARSEGRGKKSCHVAAGVDERIRAMSASLVHTQGAVTDPGTAPTYENKPG